MATFATDEDLAQLVPSLFEHGVNSFETELQRAEDDIIRKIQIDWWNKKYSPSNFDSQYLSATQWTRATCYRAIAYYILPRLSQWRSDSDAFREQMPYYKSLTQEEYNTELTIGIEYDFDEDTTVDETEIFEYDRSRLWR